MSVLEEVFEAFESWRANRKSRKEPIPERLWVMARSLLPYYKKSAICKALKLSGGKFNEYCVAFDAQRIVPILGDGFAVGAIGTEHLYDEACELTLKGLHKSLQIKTSVRNVSHILSLVEGYL